MTEREQIELYKKQIELFLGPSNIYKGEFKRSYDDKAKEEIKIFIMTKAKRMMCGNINEELMNIAID